MFGSITESTLEERIVDTAGRLAAAQCHWLLEIGDLDSGGGTETGDYASTAAWLSWNCGVQAHLAKEYVAVGCALKALPRITEEFSKGRLSYSQVRLMARVATDETEESLIYLARQSKVGQLALVVGRYKSILEAESRARFRSRGRYLSGWFDEDGFFVLRGRLCPEEGAVIESALKKVISSIDTSTLETNAEQPPGAVYNHFGALRADALVEIARQSLSSETEGVGSKSVPEVVVHIELDPSHGLGKDCHLESGVGLAAETALRVSCDAALVPLIEDGAGSIPLALRRALRARDSGCRFPGCNHKVVQGHHIKHWSRGGHTSLKNLVELCPFHHRLVHEGGYSMKPLDDEFEFFRRDGDPVPRARPTAKLPSSGLSEFATEPRSICSEWNGDPMNLGDCIASIDGWH